MCGRYSLSSADARVLQSRFAVAEAAAPAPRYNIAPGSGVLAVRTGAGGRRLAEELRWGLVPHWAKDPSAAHKMINARAETVSERAAYRGALAHFRCLIPADGFYEWQKVAGERRKQPFHITLAGGELFAFAGLWSVWHRGTPEELRSVTIITTAANAAVASIHDRMPVILSRQAEALWLSAELSPEEALGLLVAPPAQAIAVRPVGPAVNDARYDGPACLLDPPPDPQASLLTGLP